MNQKSKNNDSLKVSFLIACLMHFIYLKSTFVHPRSGKSSRVLHSRVTETYPSNLGFIAAVEMFFLL